MPSPAAQFPRSRRFITAVSLASALAVAAPVARAQNWSSTPQNNLWGNLNNWLPATVPGTGNTATFNSSSTVTAISLGGGAQAINTIAFASGTVSYNLGVTAQDT